MNGLYRQLLSLKLLRQAWHLAREDARTDFVSDPYALSEFAYTLDENLKCILAHLRQETYSPRPLLHVDVPKSTYSVRPGSMLAIEDRIVLFAIVCLIAPVFDSKFPRSVYSCRLRRDRKSSSLFRDDAEILEYPFLKRKTIQKRLQIFEPWYGSWPEFIKGSEEAYRGGYRCLSVSDIAAYFENINLEILRDILLQELPKEQKIVNLLIRMLSHWVWKTHDGRLIGRGLPQGNNISRFLSNIYLLPLDRAFEKFAEKHDISYLRYMDDVRIFSNDEAVARKVIFEMIGAMRQLHLNIQGSKTTVVRNEHVRAVVEDEALDRINQVIASMNGRRISEAGKNSAVKALLREAEKVAGGEDQLTGRSLRLLRRIITAMILLGSDSLVTRTLREIVKNPDHRFMLSACRYLRAIPHKSTVPALMKFLRSDENVFALQEGMILAVLRHIDVPVSVFDYARAAAGNAQKHWHVRQQAYLLLSLQTQSREYLEVVLTAFGQEDETEVRRAMIAVLMQLDSKEQAKFLHSASFCADQRIGSLCRMLADMRINEKEGLRSIASIQDTECGTTIIDRLYLIEVLKNHGREKVRRSLVRKLTFCRQGIRQRMLRKRLERIVSLLEGHGELSHDSPKGQ